MDFDISRILEQWEYQPGQVGARKFTAKDGTEKIQLRVDLGVLQMNLEGRPDGTRPFGHPSLFEYYKMRLKKHSGGSVEGKPEFALSAEDCAKLQAEALQYHHRYICLLQLEDFARAIRDAERNLKLFDFVAQHAETEDLAWMVRQFEPQLLMILTRAKAAQALKGEDFPEGIKQVEEGIESLRTFYRNNGRGDLLDQSHEIQSLDSWLQELRAQRPISRREHLERVLREAVNAEDYERAAQVRDELKHLKATE